MQVAQKMQKEAEERVREEMERQLREQERSRRPSRFEVIPAPDILKLQRQSATDLSMAGNNGSASDNVSVGFYFLVVVFFSSTTRKWYYRRTVIGYNSCNHFWKPYAILCFK